MDRYPVDILPNPEFYIDAKDEPNAPAIGQEHESPTNLAVGGDVEVEQGTESAQPIWQGEDEGWNFPATDTRYWLTQNAPKKYDVMNSMTMVGVAKTSDITLRNEFFIVGNSTQEASISLGIVNGQFEITARDPIETGITQDFGTITDDSKFSIIIASYDYQRDGERFQAYGYNDGQLELSNNPLTNFSVLDSEGVISVGLPPNIGAYRHRGNVKSCMVTFNNALSENQVRNYLLPWAIEKYNLE